MEVDELGLGPGLIVEEVAGEGAAVGAGEGDWAVENARRVKDIMSTRVARATAMAVVCRIKEKQD